MKNRKLIELIKYEVVKSVKTKWFIILNIIFLLGCIVLNAKGCQRGRGILAQLKAIRLNR